MNRVMTFFMPDQRDNVPYKGVLVTSEGIVRKYIEKMFDILYTGLRKLFLLSDSNLSS